MEAASLQSFEVFYTPEGVNAWVDCDIVDIIPQTKDQKLFKVVVTQ